MRTPYAASKWGVIGFTKSLSGELGPFGIRVNAICPGFVAGPRIESVLANKAAARGVPTDVVRAEGLARTSLRRFVSAEDIANAIVFLASPAGSNISGTRAADRRRSAGAHVTAEGIPVARHPFDLSGKVALVTGAHRGLGFAIARGLAEAGAVVALNGRKPEALAAAARALTDAGHRASTCVFDVTDAEAARAALRRSSASTVTSTSSSTMPASSGATGSSTSSGRTGTTSSPPT